MTYKTLHDLAAASICSISGDEPPHRLSSCLMGPC